MSELVALETQAPKAGYAMDDTRANVDPKPQLESDLYRAAGKLDGKAALVTGGDSGIGAAVAIAFAKEGADVAIAYYSSDDDAQAVAERIRELGRRALVFKGDVGDEAFCRDMVEGIAAEWGRLDVLVNNAGEQTPAESILDLTQEQLVRTFQTNIFSMFYLVKAALPHLPEGGAIVNTTSVTAYQGSPNLLDYSTTKGAITAFTRSLSENEDLVSRRIRVNGVAPGPIWTPLNPASYGLDSDKVKHFGESTPMGRPGQPYELAPAYVFLASDDSSYVSGQVIHVNGGRGERVDLFQRGGARGSRGSPRLEGFAKFLPDPFPRTTCFLRGSYVARLRLSASYRRSKGNHGSPTARVSLRPRHIRRVATRVPQVGRRHRRVSRRRDARLSGAAGRSRVHAARSPELAAFVRRQDPLHRAQRHPCRRKPEQQLPRQDP